MKQRNSTPGRKVHARVELLNNHSSGNGDAISTLKYVHIFFFALLYSSWNQLLLFSSRDLFLKEYKQNKFFFFFYFFLSLNCSLYSTYRLCWWEKMCLLTIYYSAIRFLSPSVLLFSDSSLKTLSVRRSLSSIEQYFSFFKSNQHSSILLLFLLELKCVNYLRAYTEPFRKLRFGNPLLSFFFPFKVFFPLHQTWPVIIVIMFH